MIILELLGTASFAVAGAMIGIEKKADIFGVLFLAIIASLGGGVIRDVLLGHLPPRMFTSYIYIAIAVVSAAIVFIDAYTKREKYLSHKDKLDAVVNVFDAVGLAAFTVSGMDMAIEACGMSNPLLLTALAMTTGTGGGMLRDILTNSMPMVLRKHIYAVASLAGALLYYLLLVLGVENLISAIATMGFIFGLRMLATKYRWNLPRADL